MDLVNRLDLLAQDAQYDLSCACSTSNPAEHRKRGKDGNWLYPTTVPGGGSGIMLKTLMTNACTNDCKYCPLRLDGISRRIHITPDELASFFIDLQRKRDLIGIFLSSGVIGTPDRTMQLLIDTAELLRKRYRYRGYIHIKIIPGASPAAIDRAVALASAVSLNIETPGARHFSRLSNSKRFLDDIVRPLQQISDLTSAGARYRRVHTSTQFIVGASNEVDQEILTYMWGLYSRLHFGRIYFSGYQKGLGDPAIPGEQTPEEEFILTPQRADGKPVHIAPQERTFIREHRLYQSDFLIRRYGFTSEEFLFDEQGNLDLTRDPKQVWADNHPDFFPVSIHRSSKSQLLRVPGIGPTLAGRIVSARGSTAIGSIESLRLPEHLLKKARPYLIR